MHRTLNSVIGILLMIAAVVGLVASIGGIVVLGSVHARIDSGVKHQLALLDQALTATDSGLRTASASVAQSQATLSSLQSTIGGSAGAIDDIVPAVQAMGGVVGSQLPGALEGATKALTTFANTAAVIDRVMGVLESVPFVNIPAYDPDVPLAESVSNVRDSVAGLGADLRDIQTGLDKTATNLNAVRGEVSGVSTALGGLETSLAGTVDVLSSYQEIVGDLRSQVDAANQGIEDALRWARIVATLVLAWVGIASLGMLVQGWYILQSRREPARAEATGL